MVQMTPRFSPFVRHFFLPITLAAQWVSATAADFPSAPESRIYDPDFLLTRQRSTEMTGALSKFETQNGIAVYLAIFTTTPRLIEETATDLNQSWNQSGSGVVIVFAPSRKEARVLASPQLSLVAASDELTKVFRGAIRRALDRGDFSTAAADGTAAVLKSLREAKERMSMSEEPAWRLSRKWMLLILAALAAVGGAFLWIAARVWRAANLFDHRYHFPTTGPAALRFGGQRCGGQMATMSFREKSEAKDVQEGHF
jgi:uncharacterized membrane protein YgcG